MKRGVTLLEVLFSILVISFGLLAVLATMTLASAFWRKGRLADTTGNAAHSAAADFLVKGMHERPRWIYWNATTNAFAQVPPTFNQAAATNPLFGKCFVIDPAFIAHNHDEDVAAGTNNSTLWAGFPAVPATAIPHALPMVRLTLHSGGPVVQRMSYLQADKAFRIEDELAYERPQDNSVAAVQLYTIANNQPGRRQEEGRTTWFATLFPKLDLLRGVTGEEYVLSIAVCRERTGEAMHVTGSGGPTQHTWNEWTAKILPGDFHANGIGGGELTITTNDPAQDATFAAQQYVELKSGAWIGLSRQIGGATGMHQRLQWYRVSDCGELRQNGSRWSIDATLVGQDWDVDLDPYQIIYAPSGAIDRIAYGDGTQDECDVIIVPAIAFIYERSVKIVQ